MDWRGPHNVCPKSQGSSGSGGGLRLGVGGWGYGDMGTGGDGQFSRLTAQSMQSILIPVSTAPPSGTHRK
jgi:hypothetical protein